MFSSQLDIRDLGAQLSDPNMNTLRAFMFLITINSGAVLKQYNQQEAAKLAPDCGKPIHLSVYC